MMEDRLWEWFSGCVNTPVSEVKRIRRQYSSGKDRKVAVIRYYISNHPAPSWTLVARALYMMGGLYGYESCHRSLDRLQQLFPTGTVHVIMYLLVYIQMYFEISHCYCVCTLYTTYTITMFLIVVVPMTTTVHVATVDY